MSDYKNCEWCGKSFRWKYGGHDHCSEKCKQDHHNSKYQSKKQSYLNINDSFQEGSNSGPFKDYGGCLGYLIYFVLIVGGIILLGLIFN
jgi:hypothetical protein